MKSVNLLPEEYRPRITSGTSGGAYLVVGVLGALLLAVVVYVVTLNQIGSREDQIAEAKDRTAAAEAQSKVYKPVAEFLRVKDQREQSVRQLASSRFDWERLVLELSHVVPNGVYLLSTSASLTGEEGATAAGSAPTATPTASGSPATPPKLTMLGCAPDQEALAETLVRLRRLHGAKDVTLKKSADMGGKNAAGGSTTGASSSTSANTAGSDRKCRFGEYEFEASVTFAPVEVTGSLSKPGRDVPASLGGGQ